MDRTMERNKRMQQETKTMRFLLVLAVMVFVCGLFAQITVRAQVSDRAKEIAAVQAQIRMLSAEAENLTTCINQHHNTNEISKRALAMGSSCSAAWGHREQESARRGCGACDVPRN